ncbi:unnamed protein product [Echinostoma caproni]|uniref:Endo/exonuclease/phosphatase domain-containing protein n=1 Tax=Echinostoma caproni TaxID=27848 RepID=A0A183B8B9_9TREM|nr:unnamed protein product [Echinostoma caproni]
MIVVRANRKDKPDDVVPTQLKTNQAEGDHMSTPNIQAFSCTIQSPNCMVMVVSAYRALLSDNEEDGRLRDYLARASNHAEWLVIMGDFNSPEVDWESLWAPPSGFGRKLVDLITVLPMVQHVSQYTRWPEGQRPSTSDLEEEAVRLGGKNGIQGTSHEAEDLELSQEQGAIIST